MTTRSSPATMRSNSSTTASAEPAETSSATGDDGGEADRDSAAPLDRCDIDGPSGLTAMSGTGNSGTGVARRLRHDTHRGTSRAVHDELRAVSECWACCLEGDISSCEAPPPQQPPD